MRHDRIGIRVVGVVVLEYIMHNLKTANKIDEKHPHNGIAAELVKRQNPGARINSGSLHRL